MGGIKTVWDPKKVRAKNHCCANNNTIGAFFNPNYFNTPHPYTTYINFELYTSQIISIPPQPKNPKPIENCSKTVSILPAQKSETLPKILILTKLF